MSDDYLVKNATMEQLAEAIRNVTGIESLLTPEQMIQIISVMQNVSADNKSIEIEDSTLQIKDFEKKYYKIEDNQETEITGFARDLRPITVPDGQDGYKLQWIKDRRAQEIDPYNIDADNEYPSIKAVLLDKIIEAIDEDGKPIPLDEFTAFKNMSAFGAYQMYYRSVTRPKLWELEPGWYSASGDIYLTPSETLPYRGFKGIIFISDSVIAEPYHVYIALIMPTTISGMSSGINEVFCVYVKDSEDPEDYACQSVPVLTSLVTETSVSDDDNKIPTSGAIVDYVASKLSVTEITDPNLWELDTGLYLCSGDVSVTEETVVPIGDAKVYAFINRIGEVGEESNLFTIFNMPFGIMYGYSDDASHGQIHGTVDDSQISTSFDDFTADNDHIPTTHAVVDYVEDKVPTHVEDPVLHDLDDGVYVVSGSLYYDDIIDDGNPYSILADSAYLIVSSVTLPSYSNAKLGLLLNTSPSVVGTVDINSAVTSFLVVKVGNEWTGGKEEYLSESHLTTSFASLVDDEHVPTAKAVKDYVDNLISAINGGSY